MAIALEQLALELVGLPAKSRARLAEQLISSLEEDELPDVDDLAIATAKRRAEELAEGKVQGIPAEEVMRRARERCNDRGGLPCGGILAVMHLARRPDYWEHRLDG